MNKEEETVDAPSIAWIWGQKSTFCRSHQMFADSSLCLRAVTGTMDASWLICLLSESTFHYSPSSSLGTSRGVGAGQSPCFSGGETTSWAPASTPGQNRPPEQSPAFWLIPFSTTLSSRIFWLNWEDKTETVTKQPYTAQEASLGRIIKSLLNNCNY